MVSASLGKSSPQMAKPMVPKRPNEHANSAPSEAKKIKNIP